ncbi:MAG: hypothetical protein HZC28_18495 [Spirochaetes bacterium]|nr:hypothetical protein [Spirochaetota bacterium]
MKKALFIITALSIIPLVFGSFLINRNKNTLPEYKRTNPTDKKANNYQGFESVDMDGDGFPDFTVRLAAGARTNLTVEIKGVVAGTVSEMAYTINGDIDTTEYVPFQNIFSVYNDQVNALVFKIKLKFKNGKTAPVVIKQMVITNQPPVASFYITDINWTNKVFIATNSFDPDDTLLYYAWDTDGDGTINVTYSTNATLTVYYTVLGSNFVTLFVKDNFGYSNAVSNRCIRTNVPPAASFVISNINWTNKVFDATASHDPDGGTLTYAWDTDGDGLLNTAFSSMNMIYTNIFTTLDTGDVVLYVFDGFVTNTATNVCYRTNVLPVASFTITDINWTNKVFDASASYDPDGGTLTFAWDTDGDGMINTTFSGMNMIYTNFFATLGISNVVLYVCDGFITNTKTNLCYRTNAAPTASFTIADINPTNKAFDASTSYDPDGGTLTYAWDMDGNGAIDTPFSTANIGYTWYFTALGSNNVVLYIFDGFITNTATNMCYHTNASPAAVFSISNVNSTNKIFDASASTDPDDSITGYAWDLDGNGIIDMPFSLENLIYTNYYTNFGTNQVVLYVRDLFVTNTTSNLCFRTNFWPTSVFTITPKIGTSNQLFACNAGGSFDSDGNISTYQWDFNGDGMYEVSVTSNTYATNFTNIAGQYNIALKVTDTLGAFSVTTNRVFISTNNDGLVLWNQLGSVSEVTTSACGRDLSFPNTGNYAFVPGKYGNAIGLTDDSLKDLLFLDDASSVLNPEEGTIEMWVKIAEDPLGYQYGGYLLWNGACTPWETNGANLCMLDPELIGLFNGSVAFNGTTVSVQYNLAANRNEHAFINQWMHVALVWNRSGIGGTSDCLRLYLNGATVASTNLSTWGTVASGSTFIGSGVDWHTANKFWIDNLKVYTKAKTNFSDRLTE